MTEPHPSLLDADTLALSARGVPDVDLAPSKELKRPRAIASAMAVAECLFASTSGPPPKARLAWLGRELDDFLERIGADARGSYLLGLFALSVLGPLLSFSLTPLRSMAIERRAQALSKVESSFASGLLLAVKAMLCIIYYEHPDAAAGIGFDGRCMLATPESLLGGRNRADQEQGDE
ncbi:MAG: hypothetical protein H6718_13105 [Polyangiaceae bacterium]|nr:hypothetical protein [Myxococcales bacterium]MCB9586334.1 hypothetical protein [Polyangiaceae bacterium]MCB9607011.1 hypothetical protein [Polyangiaceae bacterium]